MTLVSETDRNLEFVVPKEEADETVPQEDEYKNIEEPLEEYSERIGSVGKDLSHEDYWKRINEAAPRARKLEQEEELFVNKDEISDDTVTTYLYSFIGSNPGVFEAEEESGYARDMKKIAKSMLEGSHEDLDASQLGMLRDHLTRVERMIENPVRRNAHAEGLRDYINKLEDLRQVKLG